MKAIMTTISAIFLLAPFLFEGVFSGAISSQSGMKSQSSSSYIAGDVRVETINGVVYCDSMKCPNNSVRCQVTKRNDPNDFMKIIRHRKCIDADGKVTKEEKRTESNAYGRTVNVNIISGSGASRKLTPEEQKELDKHLKETEERIQKEIARIEESMRHFNDGSFQRDLENKINQQMMRNNLRFNPDF